MAGILILPDFFSGITGSHWRAASDPFLLDNIWETFHDQILSHIVVSLISNQVKILDIPTQVLNFGLDPLIIKDCLDLVWLWSRSYFPLLHLPIPRLTLLQLFYVIHMIHFLKMFSDSLVSKAVWERNRKCRNRFCLVAYNLCSF